MLLKYHSLETLADEDAIGFFNDHELDIMSIFSQYVCMYPELDEESTALLTMLYLLYGEDESLPDRRIAVPDNIETLFDENEFLYELYEYILIAQALHSLALDGLVEAKFDSQKNCKTFKLTNKGERTIERDYKLKA